MVVGSVCCDWRACVRPPGPLVRVPLQSIVRSSVVDYMVAARAVRIVHLCAVLCSPEALHHPLSNHIRSASNWVRTLLSSSLDISIVYLYLYETPQGYIDVAHIWKRSDLFALEVDLLPADRRDSFGKFLIPKWIEETSNALWGQNLNADLIAGRIWGGNRGPEITCHLYTRGTPATHRYFRRNWISLRLPTIFVLSFLGDLSVFNLYSLPSPVFWFAWRGRRR